MEFEALDVFRKDLKRLTKKYRSLHEDLAIVKKVLEVFPEERPPFSYRISNLGIESCVIKVKKIACKSLKGKGVNSGLRLVYAHFSPIKKSENITIERKDEAPKKKERIVFIEIYHKNEKLLEDRKRILDHFE